MKQRRPVGMIIFASIGSLYGLFLLFLGVFYIIFKTCFVVFYAVYPYKVYLTSFIYFVFGLVFLIPGLALLRRKLWGRKLFLLAVFLHMILYVRHFIKTVVFATSPEISKVGLEDILELLVVLILSSLCFWYFNRENVRSYFASGDPLTAHGPWD